MTGKNRDYTSSFNWSREHKASRKDRGANLNE